MLTEGQKAPDFTLPSTGGATVSLADFKGLKNVVLYFYPKDDTPGCTKEACFFRDVQSEFEQAGAAILGVSVDSVASHEKFAEKYHLMFPLLADEDRSVVEAYGVWREKTNYGKSYMGTAQHSLRDRQGRRHSQSLAAGQGRGAHRRGAGFRQGLVTPDLIAKRQETGVGCWVSEGRLLPSPVTHNPTPVPSITCHPSPNTCLFHHLSPITQHLSLPSPVTHHPTPVPSITCHPSPNTCPFHHLSPITQHLSLPHHLKPVRQLFLLPAPCCLDFLLAAN